MKVRKVRFSSKLFVIIMLLLIISDVTIGAVIYNRAKAALLDQIKDNAMNIARCVAASLDGSLFNEINTSDDMDSDAFNEIYDTLTVFFENGGVEYVYTIKADDNGNFIYAVDSDPEEPADAGEEFETDPETLLAAGGETAITEDITVDEWGTHLTAYSPIYDGNKIAAIAGIDVNVDWVNEQIGQILKMVIAICVIVFIIGTIVLILISRILARNFSTLNGKIVDIARGDGDLTQSILLSTGDEFEVIGKNINELLDHIRQIMIDIRGNSDILKKTTDDMANGLVTSKDNAADVSMTMQDMSSAMDQICGLIDHINELVNNMTKAFSDIASKARDGSEFSKDLRSSALKAGDDAMARKNETEEKILKMSADMQEKIESSRRVEQISVLTDEIISITDQTSLLALNASIEAARAGESGRGFAVVAGEIGNLAQSSEQAATQIRTVSAEVIKAVEDLSAQAAKMIDFMDQTALGGYQGLVDTSKDYQTGIGNIDDMMNEFANISLNVQTDIDQISESVGKLNLAVLDTSAGISKSAQMTSDISQNISNITDSAQKEKDISKALYDDVSRFKV